MIRGVLVDGKLSLGFGLFFLVIVFVNWVYKLRTFFLVFFISYKTQITIFNLIEKASLLTQLIPKKEQLLIHNFQPILAPLIRFLALENHLPKIIGIEKVIFPVVVEEPFYFLKLWSFIWNSTHHLQNQLRQFGIFLYKSFWKLLLWILLFFHILKDLVLFHLSVHWIVKLKDYKAEWIYICSFIKILGPCLQLFWTSISDSTYILCYERSKIRLMRYLFFLLYELLRLKLFLCFFFYEELELVVFIVVI